MVIKIGYFAQIKKMKHYMIPISTAIWPPKWFTGKNSNGVYLGLSHPNLVPGPRCHNLCCGPKTCGQQAENCAFLQGYYKQLQETNFDCLIEDLETIAKAVKKDSGFPEEPIIVLMVYETPDNPCSERVVLRKWFEDHGYQLENL